MTLTILDLEQRTPEWYDARRGLVTASSVGKLISVSSPGATEYECPRCGAAPTHPCLSLSNKTPTPIKTVHGERAEVAAENAATSPPVLEVADNETSRGLTALLIAERIAGWTDDTFINSDMIRGIEHEPYARDIYSGHYQQAVECGFMVRTEDDWKLGYSPDGLVADDGLVEVKCPRSKTHIQTILDGEVPPYHLPQLQAGLLVSGRKWIDYVSFCAGLPLFVRRVEPDPQWFAVITRAVQKFETEAAGVVAAFTDKTTGMPPTERIPDLELVF